MLDININKKLILTAVRNTLLVIIGTVILAFGTAVFIFPFGLVTGGISGSSIIIEKVINEALSAEAIAALLTWIAFFIGLLVLGKSFALKTLISTFIYPVALSISSLLVSENVLNGYFTLNGEKYGTLGYIIAATVGGTMIGAGCALSFLGGGSTGGTDIIAFIICKFFPKLKSSHVIFIVDSIIILLGAFIMKDLIITLLGICSALVTATVIDKLFLGAGRAFIANIISDRTDRISELVMKRLGRTTSLLDITGGYTGKKKRMLMVSFTMAEYSELIRIINQTDASAFVVIHSAHEIGGEGWSK